MTFFELDEQIWGVKVWDGVTAIWDAVVLPIVQRMTGQLLGFDIVSVQPLHAPIGQLFYMTPNHPYPADRTGIIRKPNPGYIFNGITFNPIETMDLRTGRGFIEFTPVHSCLFGNTFDIIG